MGVGRVADPATACQGFFAWIWAGHSLVELVSFAIGCWYRQMGMNISYDRRHDSSPESRLREHGTET